VPEADRSPPRPRRGGLRRRLGFLAASILLTIVAVEIALRVLGIAEPVEPSIPYVADARLGFRAMPGGRFEGPNGIEILGPQGYRGVERDLARVPGHRRLAVAGDSFVFGLEVTLEDTFVSRLDARLPDVDVWNLGVPGYGTEQQAGLLREEIPRVDPDALVLAFYVGNDPYENLLWRSSGCLAGMIVPVEWIEALTEREALGWVERELRLRRASRIYSLLVRRGLTAWIWGFVFPGAAEWVRAEGQRNVPERYRKLQAIYGAVLRPETRDRSEVVEAMDRTRQVLDGLDASLNAASVPWLLLVLPDKDQVAMIRAREAKARASGEPPPDRSELAWIQAALGDWAREKGVPCLDLLETFLAEENPMRLYAGGVHFSPEGHEKTAARLDETISSPSWRWRAR